MPGLRGVNATDQESTELAVMFRGFDTITRDVTNLPAGIRTVTRSSDELVMENQRADARRYTVAVSARECSRAALTKPEKSGWGLFGFDWNSGWNWQER